MLLVTNHTMSGVSYGHTRAHTLADRHTEAVLPLALKIRPSFELLERTREPGTIGLFPYTAAGADQFTTSQ